MLVTIASYR